MIVSGKGFDHKRCRAIRASAGYGRGSNAGQTAIADVQVGFLSWSGFFFFRRMASGTGFMWMRSGHRPFGHGRVFFRIISFLTY